MAGFMLLVHGHEDLNEHTLLADDNAVDITLRDSLAIDNVEKSAPDSMEQCGFDVPFQMELVDSSE